MQPGKISEDVALALDVSHPDLLLSERIRDLEIVTTRGTRKANLVLWSCVENKRRKNAETVVVVVKFPWFERHQPDIGTRAADAGIPRETLGVIAETELAVSGMTAAVRCDKLCLTVALEAGFGNDVECAVCAIAVFGGLAATLNFDHVDVLWIELRADVRGNVGVGNGDSIDKPGNLMAAANVQLIVNHVSARRVVGDEFEAVGASCAWSLQNFRPRDSGRESGRSRIDVDGVGPHFNFLTYRSEFEREVAKRRGIGRNDDSNFGAAKTVMRNEQSVSAGRNGVNLKAAFSVADGGMAPIR